MLRHLSYKDPQIHKTHAVCCKLRKTSKDDFDWIHEAKKDKVRSSLGLHFIKK